MAKIRSWIHGWLLFVSVLSILCSNYGTVRGQSTATNMCLMIYQLADNDLEKYIRDDNLELINSALIRKPNINTWVYFDARNIWPDIYGNIEVDMEELYNPDGTPIDKTTKWQGSRHLHFDHTLGKMIVQEQLIGEQDSDNALTVYTFAMKAVADCITTGATQYMAVFASHGGGFAGFGGDENYRRLLSQMKQLDQKQIAENVHRRRKLAMQANQNIVNGLAGALAAVPGAPPKLDVIGFDACLMMAVGALDEFRDIAQYVVGSEVTEPGHGWAYNELTGEGDIVDVGKEIVKTFVESPQNQWNAHYAPKHLAMVNVDGYNSFLEAFEQLVAEFTILLQTAASDVPFYTYFNRARTSCLAFEGFGDDSGTLTPSAIDLGSFLATFQEYCNPDPTGTLGTYLQTTMDLYYAMILTSMVGQNTEPLTGMQLMWPEKTEYFMYQGYWWHRLFNAEYHQSFQDEPNYRNFLNTFYNTNVQEQTITPEMEAASVCGKGPGYGANAPTTTAADTTTTDATTGSTTGTITGTTAETTTATTTDTTTGTTTDTTTGTTTDTTAGSFGVALAGGGRGRGRGRRALNLAVTANRPKLHEGQMLFNPTVEPKADQAFGYFDIKTDCSVEVDYIFIEYGFDFTPLIQQRMLRNNRNLEEHFMDHHNRRLQREPKKEEHSAYDDFFSQHIGVRPYRQTINRMRYKQRQQKILREEKEKLNNNHDKRGNRDLQSPRPGNSLLYYGGDLKGTYNDALYHTVWDGKFYGLLDRNTRQFTTLYTYDKGSTVKSKAVPLIFFNESFVPNKEQFEIDHDLPLLSIEHATQIGGVFGYLTFSLDDNGKYIDNTLLLYAVSQETGAVAERPKDHGGYFLPINFVSGFIYGQYVDMYIGGMRGMMFHWSEQVDLTIADATPQSLMKQFKLDTYQIDVAAFDFDLYLLPQVLNQPEFDDDVFEATSLSQTSTVVDIEDDSEPKGSGVDMAEFIIKSDGSTSLSQWAAPVEEEVQPVQNEMTMGRSGSVSLFLLSSNSWIVSTVGVLLVFLLQ